MDQWISTLITIVCSVAASSGFWALLQNKINKKDAKAQMILGLGHDRLLYLCMKYIDRGEITTDELENLKDYLYIPYKALGGNGTVTLLMGKVDSLKITQTTQLNKKEERII